MKTVLILLLLPLLASAQRFTPAEIARYRQRAEHVTIITDHWGVPHIYGKKDADAVFGLMYLQCQQNFPLVERSYLEVFGRLAELEGEGQVFGDIQMQLIYDSSAAKADYQKSPAWLRELLQAFADGVNYYLVLHPGVKPVALHRFEPWYPLMYTDGSISPTQFGGITTKDTRELYLPGGAKISGTASSWEPVPTGSNGFAIAPSRTATGEAMLYINPHVTFYFRTEVHLVSEQGLNAYGAATWGNFFIYQGFNEFCGWMHTSSYADVADVYEETIRQRGDSLYYEYNMNYLPLQRRELRIRYKSGDTLATKNITAYHTHHGPVLGKRGGKWLSLRERNRSRVALEQSWLRMKAGSFEAFKKVMAMLGNNSNNTVYADAAGNIAYWHGNFIPRRNPKIDWNLPVDGRTPATEWQGVHKLEEIVHLYNPASGWIQNCNSTPFTAAGPGSPRKEDYPEYMAPDGQNARALNAMRLLPRASGLTLDSLIAIGYDRYLSAFDILLPPLFTAYDALGRGDSLHALLGAPLRILKQWDRYAAAASVATTLAVEWGAKMMALTPPSRTAKEATNAIGNMQWVARQVDGRRALELLAQTIREMERRHGSWQVAWGDVNRYQRNAGSTNGDFSDTAWSLPAPAGPSSFGSLPSFNSRRFAGTHKRYGTSGNSFVAAVSFGRRLRAKTIVTGGSSFDPSSPHFTDQAEMFLNGRFKDVLFYKEDVLKAAVKTEKPGR